MTPIEPGYFQNFEILEEISGKSQIVDLFRQNVHSFFEEHPSLKEGNPPVVHSVKSRNKSLESIDGKIDRKLADGRGINRENVFFEITDLAGVRVLHLHQEQFIQINQAINEHVDLEEWVLVETPKAYTWDPEAIQFFEGFGFVVEQKESFYTSVHYVVRPREEAIASCEIQVRTLFEEAWGEIDHAVNYPEPSSSVACQEQLKVLARLVSAGSRLADSIFKTNCLSA